MLLGLRFSELSWDHSYPEEEVDSHILWLEFDGEEDGTPVNKLLKIYSKQVGKSNLMWSKKKKKKNCHKRASHIVSTRTYFPQLNIQIGLLHQYVRYIHITVKLHTFDCSAELLNLLNTLFFGHSCSDLTELLMFLPFILKRS